MNWVQINIQVNDDFRYMKIHIFAQRWRDEIERSSQLRTLLKRVVVNNYCLVTQHARGLHLNENKILHCPITSMMHTHSNYCSNQAADNQTQLIIL